MKKIAILLLIIISIFYINYAIGAFHQASFNLSEWEETFRHRLAQLTGVMVFGFLIVSIVNDTLKDT